MNPQNNALAEFCKKNGLNLIGDNRAAIEACMVFTDQFRRDGYPHRCVTFHGPTGRGKTRLLQIMRDGLKARGITIRETIRMRDISKCFVQQNLQRDEIERARSYLSYLEESIVLFIDDAGYEELQPVGVRDQVVAWMNKTVDRIYTDEKKQNLGIVIASEYTASQIHEKRLYGIGTDSLVSRLRSMSESGSVNIGGPDWRNVGK